jgi:hypothetical protein
MGFFSFLKYTFIIFSAYLATSCGSPFENHGSRESRVKTKLKIVCAVNFKGGTLMRSKGWG